MESVVDFDIKVGGNTDLKGAVIASDATPDKNKLSTGTLTYSDIQNKADYSSSSIGVNYNTGKDVAKKDQGLTPNIGVTASGNADSTTKSAISPGTITIHNNPNQDISNLSRDPASAINALGKIFDKKTVQEQQELAKVFSEEAFKIVGDIAQKQQEKADIAGALAKSYQTAADKARSQGDIETAQKYEALAGQMNDMESQLAPWRDGGAYKITMHSLIGGLAASMGGGNFASGATGAGASEATYALLKNLPPDLQQWGSAVIGAAASKVTGGTAQTGAATGSSGTANNGLTHIAGGVLDGVVDSLKKDGKALWETFTDPVSAAVAIKDAGEALYSLGKEQGFGAVFKELGTALSGDCLNKYNTIQSDFENGNIDENTRDYRLGILAGEVTYLVITTVPAPEKLAINPTLASKFEKIGALRKTMDISRFTNEGWDLVKGGKRINGREYSEHALERMAPNTLQIRAELEARAIEKGYERGTPEFTKYVDPRGIPPSVVEDAINNGTRIPGNTPYTWVCTTQDVKVVINAYGDVITVIPK